jgi:predicted ATPase
MPGYILTGSPGAGKTAILRLLEISGYVVVEEAATDVIAVENALGRQEPWSDHGFIDKVITLQRQRQDSVRAAGSVVFFDRSPVCTLALSRYLGLATSPLLVREVDRVVAEGAYEEAVFFIRNQGLVRSTAARRISFEDSLVFEQLHEQAYRDLGFQLVEVPAGPLPDRVALVRRTVDQLAIGQLAGERLRVRSLSHKNSRTSGTTSPPIP